MTSLPTWEPSTKKSTRVTPTASDAVATIWDSVDKDALFDGEVILTVGAVVSAGSSGFGAGKIIAGGIVPVD